MLTMMLHFSRLPLVNTRPSWGSSCYPATCERHKCTFLGRLVESTALMSWAQRYFELRATWIGKQLTSSSRATHPRTAARMFSCQIGPCRHVRRAFQVLSLMYLACLRGAEVHTASGPSMAALSATSTKSLVRTCRICEIWD